MLKGRKTKHWMRTWYTVNSIRRLKQSLMKSDASTDYFQAGKSVAGIHDVRPAAQIVREYAAALDSAIAS
jgi:nitronate monooxygenase